MRLKEEMKLKMADNPSLTAHTATISVKAMARYCKTCESEIKSRNSKREFCCDRCRLLHWAIKILVKEYKAGRASGLRGFIKELCK